MPYCTLDDIKTRRIPEETMIQLTDDAELGTVDQATVDAAIVEADELIDGYLRGRYTLPLAPIPGLLVRLSASIAAYQLYGRRPEFDTPERVKNDHDYALKTLAAIQRGDVKLGVTEPAAAEDPSTLQTSGAGKLFGPDILDRY